jgi:catechol 2,3-dioxygenase-like lactoylglutathione lyase family enzyme
MLGYATIGTNDLPRALAFYDALLGEVGAKRLMETPHGFTMYGVTLRKPALAVTPPYDGKKATPGNGNMLALSLDARASVDALYKKAMRLGRGSARGSRRGRAERFLRRLFSRPGGKQTLRLSSRAGITIDSALLAT